MEQLKLFLLLPFVQLENGKLNSYWPTILIPAIHIYFFDYIKIVLSLKIDFIDSLSRSSSKLQVYLCSEIC